MAGSFKRQRDKARGKTGKWNGWYLDRQGIKQEFVGTADRASTLELAQAREREERLIREGLADPAELARRQAAARPLDAHIEDYREALIASGNTEKYARGSSGMVRRLLASAKVHSIADLAPDRIGEALGRLRRDTSAATHNAYLTALKRFTNWLDGADRIAAVPKGIRTMRRLNAKVDRKRVRRVPAAGEWPRLLAATEAGPTILRHSGGTRYGPVVGELTGPDRAMLYRVAAATGFRANELRSLTPESFDLEGDAPAIIVEAAYSKNRRRVRQPIDRATAAALRPWVASLEPGRPAWFVPEKTGRMIREDLARAEIKAKDDRGRVLDFHALRAFYITDLYRRGVDPKELQRLARHSTITLTMDVYLDVDDEALRRAIEKGKDNGSDTQGSNGSGGAADPGPGNGQHPGNGDPRNPVRGDGGPPGG